MGILWPYEDEDELTDSDLSFAEDFEARFGN